MSDYLVEIIASFPNDSKTNRNTTTTACCHLFFIRKITKGDILIRSRILATVVHFVFGTAVARTLNNNSQPQLIK